MEKASENPYCGLSMVGKGKMERKLLAGPLLTKRRGFRLDRRKKMLMLRVLKHTCPREAAGSPSLGTFKVRLDRSNSVYLKMGGDGLGEYCMTPQ